MTRSSAGQLSLSGKTLSIGDTTSKTITDIITVHTALAPHGTGAVITILGIGMHGLIIVLGDSTDGTTTAIGMAVGTTLGTMEAPGDSMTLGTTEDSMADGAHIIHIMQVGTED